MSAVCVCVCDVGVGFYNCMGLIRARKISCGRRLGCRSFFLSASCCLFIDFNLFKRKLPSEGSKGVLGPISAESGHS